MSKTSIVLSEAGSLAALGNPPDAPEGDPVDPEVPLGE